MAGGYARGGKGCAFTSGTYRSLEKQDARNTDKKRREAKAKELAKQEARLSKGAKGSDRFNNMAGDKGKEKCAEDANAHSVAAEAARSMTSSQPNEQRPSKVSTTEAFGKAQSGKGSEVFNDVSSLWMKEDLQISRQRLESAAAKKEAKEERQEAWLLNRPPAYNDEGSFDSDMLIILGQKDICAALKTSLIQTMSQMAKVSPDSILSCTAMGQCKDDGSRKLVMVFRSPKTAFQVLLSRKAIYEYHTIQIVENLNQQEQDLKRARQGIFNTLAADRSKYVQWRGAHIFVAKAVPAGTKIVWSRYNIEGAEQPAVP